jgi:DNA-binding NarL/FixJ family response regulator
VHTRLTGPDATRSLCGAAPRCWPDMRITEQNEMVNERRVCGPKGVHPSHNGVRGRGTRKLGEAQPAMVAKRAARPAAAAESPPSIVIAIVDPDETARQTVQKQIEGAGRGWIAITYASAEEALQGNRATTAPLLITELRLGDHCGIKLARRLRRATPSTRVVMHTSQAGPEIVWGALSAGARGYLVKPTAATKLVDALTLVLRGEYAFCDRAQAVVLRGIERMGEFAELHSLSPREYEVLAYVSRTRTTQEAPRELNIAKGTLHCYKMSLFKKLGVHGLGDAVELFLSFVTFGVNGNGVQRRRCLGCDQ